MRPSCALGRCGFVSVQPTSSAERLHREPSRVRGLHSRPGQLCRDGPRKGHLKAQASRAPKREQRGSDIRGTARPPFGDRHEPQRCGCGEDVLSEAAPGRRGEDGAGRGRRHRNGRARRKAPAQRGKRQQDSRGRKASFPGNGAADAVTCRSTAAARKRVPRKPAQRHDGEPQQWGFLRNGVPA